MEEEKIQAEEVLRQQFLEICRDIETQLHQGGDAPVLVAIDGQCASGKTTLGEMLARRFDCNLFHMDDFFLRPEQRTPERLAQVGGNVDYERFRHEVLQPVLQREAFTYRIYDCKSRQYAKTVPVPVRRLNIVEGSYSRHPYFGDYYQLGYCLLIEAEEQEKRILKRNGADMLKRFMEEWIPKENAYLEMLGLKITAERKHAAVAGEQNEGGNDSCRQSAY